MPYASPPFIGSGLTSLKTITSLSSEDVKIRHPIYNQLYNSRMKCFDIVCGQDKIKEKGEKYLKRLAGQSNADYKNYLDRALFFSIGAKSLQALVGMASLKMPKIEADDELSAKYFNFDEDITFLESYVNMLTEVLKQNQAAIMIDWPQSGGDPYIEVYSAFSPINWSYDEDGNLEMVVLCESYEKRIGRYGKEINLRYRELYLENGQYHQMLHIDGKTPQKITPKINGKPLDYIPFIPFHSKGIGFTSEPPLLLDIANINISHYMSSADLEHGRHFTGLPTPIIFGASSTTDLYIGSNQFIVLPDKQSNAKYLEFTGQGLQSLEKALAEKQAMLASLSARLLDNSSKGSESTDAVKLRYLSETASLTSIVKTINVVLNKVYNCIAESMNKDKNSVTISLDTDFLGSKMSSTEMTALFDGYLSGAIDVGTLIHNLRAGQRLDPNASDDQVKTDIEKNRAFIESQKSKSNFPTNPTE